VTLDWSVANTYSGTLQQCYAFIQSTANGGGTWTGLQTGTFDSTKTPPYSGSATITPTLEGTYTYALTCGGMESGFATLTVTGPAASVSVASGNGQTTFYGSAFPNPLVAIVKDARATRSPERW